MYLHKLLLAYKSLYAHKSVYIEISPVFARVLILMSCCASPRKFAAAHACRWAQTLSGVFCGHGSDHGYGCDDRDLHDPSLQPD